jgi:hypothetical protein
MLNPETWLSAYTHTSHVVFCPASTFREKIVFSEDNVLGLRGEIVKYLLYLYHCDQEFSFIATSSTE